MLQVINHLSRGGVELSDVPCPRPSLGSALIRTRRSLISVGTERMLVDFGRANLIEKARQQPDKVRQVLDKAKASIASICAATQTANFQRNGVPHEVGSRWRA